MANLKIGDQEVTELKCTVCRVQSCSAAPGTKPYPTFCPIPGEPAALTEARHLYDEDAETQRLARAAAQVEAAGYCRWPRVQEIMEFARRIDASRLGIATCIGLIREAGLLQEILEANGFTVHSICCKTGNIPKEELGLTDAEKVRPGQFEVLCNPVGQALLLNQAGTT